MNSLRVAWLYFRIGTMNEMQYRVNFFVQLVQSVIAIGTGLVGLWLVFAHTHALGSWTLYQLLIVMGVFTLMGGLIQTVIQPNMERLMGEVQDGTLDYAFTKPVDAQLLVSVREIRFWNLVDVLTGLLVVIYGIIHLPTHPSLLSILAFLAVLVLGGLMIYSFWMLLTTCAFWVVRMDELVNLFQGVYNAGRFPVTIYPGWMRAGLTFIIPVAFAVTVPSEALTNRLTGATVLGALALTAALLTLTRLFWRLGVRRYSGASA